jgi:hypothetical protein
MREIEMGAGVEEEGRKRYDEKSDAEPGENVSAIVLAGRGSRDADDQVQAAKELCEEGNHRTR